MATPYSRKETDLLVQNINTGIQGMVENFEVHRVQLMKEVEEIKADGKETKVQLKLLNGSVNSLKLWRAYLTGGGAVLVFIIASMLIPIMASFIQAGKI